MSTFMWIGAAILWWLVGTLTALESIQRFLTRNISHQKTVTYGDLVMCALVFWVFGPLWVLVERDWNYRAVKWFGKEIG